MNRLDINEINVIADGMLDKREMQGNDMFVAMYQGAILNSLAVWGSKDFPKRPPKYRIKPMSDEEEAQEILNSIMKTGMMLTLEAEKNNSGNNVAYNKEQAKKLYEQFVADEIGAIDR